MSRPDSSGIDWIAVSSVVIAFVVIASAVGGGTFAVLSDIESESGALTVGNSESMSMTAEPQVTNGMVQVQPISCGDNGSTQTVGVDLEPEKQTRIKEFQITGSAEWGQLSF